MVLSNYRWLTLLEEVMVQTGEEEDGRIAAEAEMEMEVMEIKEAGMDPSTWMTQKTGQI